MRLTTISAMDDTQKHGWKDTQNGVGMILRSKINYDRFAETVIS